MEELSARKKAAVVRGYFAGESYDAIARRVGVSKGAVAGIVSALKSGQFPEVQEPADQIELLREVAVELRKANVTPEGAMVGLAVLTRLRELHIEPGDVDSWAAVYRQLGEDEPKMQVFIRTALLVDEICQQRGLTFGELEAKASELREEVAHLEPMVEGLRECRKNLSDLQKREKAATAETVPLEKHRDALRSEIAQREKREAQLAQRVEGLEERADAAEERLITAQNGQRLLEKLGLSPEGLSGFAQRVDGVAQRHGIEPEALRDRLLSELEKLDECLSLDVLTEARKAELANIDQEIAVAREEKIAELSAAKQLRQEKAELGRALQEETARVRKEIAGITSSTRDATNQLMRDFSVALSNTLAQVEEIRNRALHLGEEMARYEAIAGSNEWARSFSRLLTGDGDVAPAQVKVAGLTMLLAISRWAQRRPGQVSLPPDLMQYLSRLIKELENWQTQPPTSS